MGCSSGKKTMLATRASALSHAGLPGSLAIRRSGSLLCTGSSYWGAGLSVRSMASAI